MDSILHTNIYNYAFTGVHSPYGKIYDESIKAKLKKGHDTTGIFIPGVNPLTIASKKRDSERLV